jgi:hypothetical protein
LPAAALAYSARTVIARTFIVVDVDVDVDVDDFCNCCEACGRTGESGEQKIGQCERHTRLHHFVSTTEQHLRRFVRGRATLQSIFVTPQFDMLTLIPPLRRVVAIASPLPLACGIVFLVVFIL